MANETVAEVQVQQGTMLEMIRNFLEEYEGSYRFKMQEEQRAMLNKKDTYNTLAVSGKIMDAKSVDYAVATEKLINADSEADIHVVADQIVYRNLEGKEETIECAVAKTTNVCTSSIVDGSVMKLYSGSSYRKGMQMADARTELRSQDSIAGLSLFSKPAEQQSNDRVVKRNQFADNSLSATVVPSDIRQMEYMNRLVTCQHSLKTVMLIEFLRTMSGNASDSKLEAFYKNINRGLVDDIFLAEFQKKFGLVDAKDMPTVMNYRKMYQIYQQNIITQYPDSAAQETIGFGLYARQLRISPSAIWSNGDKAARVKQFSEGSYFVSSNVDLGLNRIPTTSEIVAKYKHEIDTIVAASMRFVENEARLQAGLKNIKNHELIDIEMPKELSYTKILGITQEKEDKLLEDLRANLSRTAAEICDNQYSSQTVAAAEAIRTMLNG